MGRRNTQVCHPIDIHRERQTDRQTEREIRSDVLLPASLYRTTGVLPINGKYSSLDTPSDMRDPGGIVPKRCARLCWVGCQYDDFAPKPGAGRPCPVPRPILRSASNKPSTGLPRDTPRATGSRWNLPESMCTHVIESLLWWVLVDLSRLPRPPVRPLLRLWESFCCTRWTFQDASKDRQARSPPWDGLRARQHRHSLTGQTIRDNNNNMHNLGGCLCIDNHFRR